MSSWVVVKMKHTGQVQEMVPAVAQSLIANGLAEEFKPVQNVEQKPGTPVVPIETATLVPAAAQTAVQPAAYVRGPRTR
jgi:hypothetical protein